MPNAWSVPQRYAPQRVELYVRGMDAFSIRVIAKSGEPLMTGMEYYPRFEDARKRALFLASALGVVALFSEFGGPFYPLGYPDEKFNLYETMQAVKREKARNSL